MDDRNLKADFERALAGVRFSDEMKARVRTRIAAQARPPARPVFMRRGLALALVCAVLFAVALAAGPAVWDLIQTHLGPSASYAALVEHTATDQGIEVKTVAALTDRNTIRVYLTLRDLEGDRLADGALLDLWPLKRDESGAFILDDGAPNGGTPVEQVGYAAEQRILTICKTFYSAEPQTSLNLSVRELVPGSRDYYLLLDEAKAAALAAAETLESAWDADGNCYLLPDQNPYEMDWEKHPLPIGEEPGVYVSSMGFAEDGRFHIRLRTADDTVLTRVFLPEFRGMSMELSAELENGVDYRFPEGGPGRADLTSIFLFCVTGEYSTQGGAIQGVWDMEVPLKPVDTLELSWPGGALTGAHGQSVTVEGLWLSPLGLSMDCRTEGGASFLQVSETPVITLKDGTQVPVKQGDLVFGQGQEENDQLNGVTERLLWELETPTELEEIASVTIFHQTISLAE